MPRKRGPEPSQAEIIRLALEGIDAQIAALQEKRARLAKKLPVGRGSTVTAPGAEAVAEKGRRKSGRKRRRRVSAETRRKISESTKARWAERKAREVKTMEARARAQAQARARGKKAQASQAA